MHRNKWKWKHDNPILYWDSVKRSARGKVRSNTSLPLEKKDKNQINRLTLHLKQQEKEEIKNSRVSRRKKNIKIRPDISEKENKETIAKIS